MLDFAAKKRPPEGGRCTRYIEVVFEKFYPYEMKVSIPALGVMRFSRLFHQFSGESFLLSILDG